MSDWGWVAFAYGVVYAALAGYLISVVVRIRRVRRAMGGR